MPSLRLRTVLAAGGVTPNMLAGSQFEFLEQNSRVQIFAIDDNAVAGVGEIEVFFGAEIQLPQSRPNVAGIGPVVPNDLVVDDFAVARDRITVRATETGGALGTTVIILVKIDPIG